jgi:hypothetical protein
MQWVTNILDVIRRLIEAIKFLVHDVKYLIAAIVGWIKWFIMADPVPRASYEEVIIITKQIGQMTASEIEACDQAIVNFAQTYASTVDTSEEEVVQKEETVVLN